MVPPGAGTLRVVVENKGRPRNRWELAETKTKDSSRDRRRSVLHWQHLFLDRLQSVTDKIKTNAPQSLLSISRRPNSEKHCPVTTTINDNIADETRRVLSIWPSINRRQKLIYDEGAIVRSNNNPIRKRGRERDKLLSLSICRRKPRTLLRGRFPLNWFNRFEFAEEDFRRCKCVTFFPLHCDDDVKSVTSCRLPTDYLANRSIHLDCQLAMQQHLSLVYDHTHATDSIEFE